LVSPVNCERQPAAASRGIKTRGITEKSLPLGEHSIRVIELAGRIVGAGFRIMSGDTDYATAAI
jgi:hypothetical protein